MGSDGRENITLTATFAGIGMVAIGIIASLVMERDPAGRPDAHAHSFGSGDADELYGAIEMQVPDYLHGDYIIDADQPIIHLLRLQSSRAGCTWEASFTWRILMRQPGFVVQIPSAGLRVS